ncbi:MAG TPA: hypothetical protein VND19_11280 [Acetobacteraceae bacterium]|nr:hypothetical protein [Acetobacteraceae bacterium]
MGMEAAELRDCGRLKGIRAFIDGLYAHDIHAKRVDSLAAATLGVMTGAFAMALLTMLGAAGESLGMDRLLKSNTAKTRTHSLFRQGCMLYEPIPNMPLHRLLPLMQRFAEMLVSSGLLGKSLSEAE